MSADNNLRILVVSDLHGYQTKHGDKAPSAFAVSRDAPETTRLCNGIIEELRESDIQIDLVVCPGDIADTAEPAGLIGAWGRLNELADKLQAPLIATVGNHDLESRPDAGHLDPRETLINLVPEFPAPKHAVQAAYFAYHFAVAEVPGAKVLTLNSCSTHGLMHQGLAEYSHGRISRATADRMKRDLEESDYHGLQIVITHHHPLQLPLFDQGESSVMNDATYLLEALEASGDWLIIHGHKHRSWLHYAHGGGGSAVILSASSLSASLDGDFAQSSRNQFHVVDVNDPDSSAALGLGMSGVVHTWNRVPYGPRAWSRATHEDTLMGVSGFGWRITPRNFAQRLSEWLDTQTGSLDELDLERWEPRVRFLAPQDMRKAVQIMNRSSNYSIEINSAGMPSRIRTVPRGDR